MGIFSTSVYVENLGDLGSFEYENEIPFGSETLNKTLYAMIGDIIPQKFHYGGLLEYNKNKQQIPDFGIGNVGESNHNDVFGLHSFDQVKYKFSIVVKHISNETSNIKIKVTKRPGFVLTDSNICCLQNECERFISALTYYLQNQNYVDEWYKSYESKKQQHEIGIDKEPEEYEVVKTQKDDSKNSNFGITVISLLIMFSLIILCCQLCSLSFDCSHNVINESQITAIDTISSNTNDFVVCFPE